MHVQNGSMEYSTYVANQGIWLVLETVLLQALKKGRVCSAVLILQLLFPYLSISVRLSRERPRIISPSFIRRTPSNAQPFGT